MGTKVQCESYFPGYFSMTDLNEDSNGCGWPLFYGDKTFTNGQYCNGFLPRVIVDAYPGNDKDVVKRTMLGHEAIFKNQLYELHRLYRKQRDLMDEFKRKELHKNRMPVETSFSSSPLASQITSEDARKWQIPSFPLANSICSRPSTSGVEDVHSPLRSMKGSSTQASPLLSQNGGTSMDLEMLDSRPSKVRRRMFDLQLPADEYIDTEEEQFRDENVSGVSSNQSNRNHKIAPENGVNIFLGNGEKNNCQGDASRSESCFRNPIDVTDLNKPVEVEETNGSAYVNLRGCTTSHGDSRGHDVAAKPKQDLLGFPKEISMNSYHRSDNGTLNNPHLDSNANGKCLFPSTIDSGLSKNNLKSFSPDLEPEKLPISSQPIQVLFNKTSEPQNHFLIHKEKVDQLRERTARGLELSERNHEIFNSNFSESVVASHISSPYPIPPPSNVSKSWSHSVSSWEKPTGSSSQKPISVQIQPYLNSSATLNQSFQSSTQSHGFFRDQRNHCSNYASNPTFGSEVPYQNGFYYGSSSRSKEPLARLPSGNYNYWNCTSTDNGSSEHLINHSSANCCKSSTCVDLKSAKDVNLNAVRSNSSSNKAAFQQGIEVIDLERKHEDHLPALPWLKFKPACKNEATNVGMDLNTRESDFLQSSLNQLSDKSESGKGPNQVVIQNITSTSCSNVVEVGWIQISESSSCRKILGFPIFEKPYVSKNESSSFTSSSMSLTQPSDELEHNRKSRVLDINLPCDPGIPDLAQQTAAEVLGAKETDTITKFRHQIDLNSSISDDETSLMPDGPGFAGKIIIGIDLEAPAVPESEEDTAAREETAQEALLHPTQNKAESPQDEIVRIAAEAIVAISSSDHQNHLDDATSNQPEASMTDPLHWFVEIASSCGEDLESRLDAFLKAEGSEHNVESSGEIIDYFESMTLRLVETKEEDYMPKPLVPEDLKFEDTGATPLPTRTRRGQARRGRQRRDFQRDILPGLASLSRHEVTEDLQTFGGLMRATGHSWHSGLMRRNSTRNGCARGRRRSLISSPPTVKASPPCTPLIQQLHNIEVGLEDRNLTGWGKTTRRPRRQRCPAGNPTSQPLT